MDPPVHRNEQTGNPALDRLQANVRALIAALRLVPFLFSGRLVTNQTFAANVARSVRHGLGHRVNGYIIVRNYGTNVYCTVGESGATVADPLNDISMITLQIATYDLWFY